MFSICVIFHFEKSVSVKVQVQNHCTENLQIIISRPFGSSADIGVLNVILACNLTFNFWWKFALSECFLIVNVVLCKANLSSEQSSPATSFSESSPKPPRRCMSSETSHASDHPSSAAASRPSYGVCRSSPTHRLNQEHSRSSDRSSVKSGRSGMSG